MIMWLYCAVLLTVTVVQLQAQEQSGGSVAGSENLQAHSQEYAALSRQVKHTRGDDTTGRAYHSKAGDSINEKLRKIVEAEVIGHLDVLANSEKAVRDAIVTVQGPIILDAVSTSAPFAKLFDLPGTREAAVAYILDQGGDFLPDILPYLEFYDKLTGVWRLRATAPTVDDFRSSTFFVQQMSSGIPTESWWLAWGSKFGNTGGAKRAVLYAYDGEAVKIIWRRDGLIEGEISATGDTVTLDYDPEYKPRHPMSRVHEVYKVSPNGLIQAQQEPA